MTNINVVDAGDDFGNVQCPWDVVESEQKVYRPKSAETVQRSAPSDQTGPKRVQPKRNRVFYRDAAFEQQGQGDDRFIAYGSGGEEVLRVSMSPNYNGDALYMKTKAMLEDIRKRMALESRHRKIEAKVRKGLYALLAINVVLAVFNVFWAWLFHWA